MGVGGVLWACGECLRGGWRLFEGCLIGEGVAAAMPFILGCFCVFLYLRILPNSYYLVYLQMKNDKQSNN